MNKAGRAFIKLVPLLLGALVFVIGAFISFHYIFGTTKGK